MSRRKRDEVFKLTLSFVVDEEVDAQTRQDEMWLFSVLFQHAMGGYDFDDAVTRKHADTAVRAMVRMFKRRQALRATKESTA